MTRIPTRVAAALGLGLLTGAAMAAPAARAAAPAPQVVYLARQIDADESGDDSSTFYSLEGIGASSFSARSLTECDGSSDPLEFPAGSVCPTGGPSFSADGGTLLFSGFSNPGQDVKIFRVSASGGKPAWVRTKGLGAVSYPAFLPGGATVVLSGRATKSSATRLYTVPAAGGTATALTSSTGSEPAVCGDGRVVYVHNGSIYMLKAGQHGVGTLLARNGAYPVCSHDSRTVVYVASHSRSLVKVSMSTRRAQTIPHTSGADGRPALSPAGTQVAFSQNGPCNAKVCDVNLKDDWSLCGVEYLTVVDLDGDIKRQKLEVTADTCIAGDNPEELTDVAWRP